MIEKIASVPAKPDNPSGMRIKGPRQQPDIRNAENIVAKLVIFSLKIIHLIFAPELSSNRVIHRFLLVCWLV
ncbi:hypothetical protein ACTHQ2_24425 [Bacillus subtilis]|uniref:hypothetical protein n=1 Tax=Bacillus subtilis TaxID=1423 RepID=UPI003F7BC2B7